MLKHITYKQKKSVLKRGAADRMNGNEFKNVFPVKKPNRTIKIKRLNMINIGQILLISFLLIIICMQISGITPGLADLFRNFTDGGRLPLDKASSGANQNSDINPAQSAGDTNKNNGENINVDNAAKDKSPEIIFILGEENGKLAVLSPDGQTVYETYDVYINTLPDYDKNLLLNGIKIKTAEELRSLLEDYSS